MEGNFVELKHFWAGKVPVRQLPTSCMEAGRLVGRYRGRQVDR